MNSNFAILKTRNCFQLVRVKELFEPRVLRKKKKKATDVCSFQKHFLGKPIFTEKRGSESVRKTESFDSFFVLEMTHPWTKVCHFSPSVSSHGQKMSQMTQFCILTHFDVFCVSVTLGDFTIKKRKIGKGNLYTTENRLSWNEMCCAADNHNYVCRTCANEVFDSNLN